MTSSVANFESNLKERLRTRFGCTDPVGYSNQEIDEHLAFFDQGVGEIFRTFQRVCGRENGGMFIYGHHWQLPELRTRNEEMYLVADEYEYKMNRPMFSFLDYIGDYFWCIEGNAGDDPPVVRFDLDEFVPMTDKLSTFLLNGRNWTNDALVIAR